MKEKINNEHDRRKQRTRGGIFRDYTGDKIKWIIYNLQRLSPYTEIKILTFDILFQ